MNKRQIEYFENNAMSKIGHYLVDVRKGNCPFSFAFRRDACARACDRSSELTGNVFIFLFEGTRSCSRVHTYPYGLWLVFICYLKNRRRYSAKSLGLINTHLTCRKILIRLQMRTFLKRNKMCSSFVLCIRNAYQSNLFFTPIVYSPTNRPRSRCFARTNEMCYVVYHDVYR